MAIARVNRQVRQPQYPVTVDTANPITRGLVRALVCEGSAIRDLVVGTGIAVFGSYVPQATAFGYGRRNTSFTKENYTTVDARTETVSALTIVWSGIVHRVGGTTYPFFRNQQTIIQATGTTGPLWSARFGSNATVNSTLPIKIGSPTTYVYRKSGAIGAMWVDGVPAFYNVAGGETAHIGAHNIDSNSSFLQSNGITTGVMLIYDRPLSDAESRSLSINPWQVFRPVQRRIYFDMGTGGTTEITLLGTNGAQSNIAALDAIAQSHYLISTSDTQYTTGSIGPITLSQSLSVTSSESKNTTSSGTVYQTHALLATQANQKNVGAGVSVILEQTFSAQSVSSAAASTASAISQIHALVGQATTQSNVSLTPSISQVGSFVAVSAQQTSLSSPASISQAQTISATQSNQATVASTASITQSHQISSQSVNQAQVSSTAPISLTQALTVVAANQSNIAPPVLIVQGNVSAAASGVQNNTTSLGTITQTQTLVGESSQSTNVGSTATISQTIDLSAVAANQHAIGDSNTIWQAQFVQSQTATQSNTASVGDISTVPVIWLSAVISDQVITSPAASITQDHNFAIIPGSSRNVSISGIIAQIHELYAIAANQATVSIGGQVAVIDYSQTPSIYTATSPLIRYNVDSPEIPYAVDSPQIVYQVFATK